MCLQYFPTLPLKHPSLSMGDLSPSLSPNCHGHNHPSEQQQSSTIGFNAMVIMAAMVCALVCALGLNSTLQCVFQCTYRALTEPRQWLVSRRQNSGLKKKEVVALPTSTFENNNSGNSPSSSASASGTSCAICLVDFIDGDKIRLLPKCNHRFHIACIDKWLFSHSSCPTCRHRLKNSNGSLPSLDQIVVTPL